MHEREREREIAKSHLPRSEKRTIKLNDVIIFQETSTITNIFKFHSLQKLFLSVGGGRRRRSEKKKNLGDYE